MSDGGTNYDLKLGLDTGPAKPEVQGLTAELIKSGEAADQAQVHLDGVSAASGKVASSARSAGSSLSSAASSNDRFSSSAAKTDTAATAAGSSISKMGTSASGVESAAAKASRSTDVLSSSATKTAATTEQLSGATTRLSTSLGTEAREAAAASSATDKLEASSGRASSTLSGLWKTIVGIVGVYASLQAGIAGFRSVVDNFSTYETALVDVSKTTGITGRDLKDFYGDILHMSTSSVPLATKDLLGIAQAAGSLGVSGKENIERYATSVGKLSAASEDLKGAEAATLLTRMMNVQGEGPENIERLSSVIVRLGLSSAATEREIAVVGTEVSKGTAAFKIGSTQAAAYGAALAEMGIEAEAGSTALQHTFGVIQAAVSIGGKALNEIAKVAGVSAKQFADTWKADKIQGLNLFLKGLRQFGDDAGSVLKKVGLPDVRVQKTLETFAFNFDKLAEKQRMAADEAKNVTALTEKSALVFASTTSDLVRLQNAYEGVEKIVGDALAPALRDASVELRDFAEEADNGAQRLGEAMGQAVHQLVALLILLARNVDLVKNAIVALLAVKFSAWVALAVTQLGAWLGAVTGIAKAAAASSAAVLAEAAAQRIGAQATAEAAAAKVIALEASIQAGQALILEEALLGETASVADLYAVSIEAAGDAIVRTGTVADLYNEDLIRYDATAREAAAAQLELAAATEAAGVAAGNAAVAVEAETIAQKEAASTSKFWNTSITGVAVGLGILLAVILQVNDKIVEFSRTTQAEMEAMVQKTNDFAASIRKLRDDTKSLLSDQAKQAEVQRKLLEEGIQPGKSPKDDQRAQQIQNEVEIDFQKRRVASLYEQKTALEENQKALAGYQGQLGQLKDQEKALLQQQEENKKALTAAAADPHDSGMDAAARSMSETGAQLEVVRSKMVETQNVINMTGTKVKTLTRTTDDLTASTKNYVPPAEESKRSLDELGKTVDKAEQKYEHLTDKIDGATRAQVKIASAYAVSTAEGRKVEQQMDLQNRQFEAAGMYEGALKQKIEDRVKVQVAAERTATGEKTIADLKDQVAAAEKLQAALATGLQPAIEQARREQDLLQQKLHNTAGAATDQAGTIEGLTSKLDGLNRNNAFATQEEQIKKETAALADSAKTWDGTTASITNTNNVLQINAQISQAIVGHTDDEAAAIARLIRQQNLYNALFQARMNLGQIEEETRKQQDLYDIKRSDYLFEFQYQAALRRVNTEHEVRSALLSVEFLRQKALTSVKREDYDTEQAYLAQRSSIGKQFDDIAARTETAIRKQGELYVEIKKIDTLGEDVWGAFAESMKSAVTQAFETGKVDWEGIWKSLMDRLLGTFLDVLEEMFKRWVATQIAMAAASAAINGAAHNAAAGSATSAAGGGVGGGLTSIGGTAGGIWSGSGSGGVTAAGIWGSGGTAGVAGSGSGVAGLFSGTGAAGAAGMVAAWVAVMVVFAIAVEKVSAHLQKTEESVISFDSSLDVNMVKGGAHIDGLVSAGQKLAQQIKGFFNAYDGVFKDLNGEIAIKRRGQGGNTEWKVYVDGMVTSFGKDATAAMNYALIEAIKHSDATGLDPLVVAAIKDYAGKDLDEFKASIDFAQRIATQNLPGVSGQVASASQQYNSDLHQAQETFKGDAEALDSAIASITKKFEDTVQGLKNSALGIDTSTADFLASLGAFNVEMQKTGDAARKQIEDQIAADQAAITQLGSGPRINRNGDAGSRDQAQSDWEATLARLKAEIAQYTDELNKIPEALSNQEMDMAIFDSLYKYLEGSSKYAKQAHEYAVLKVQLEFEAIKAQLIALGKWEQFSGMWQDALNAATRTANGQGAHSGGGSGKKQDREDFLKSLQDIERSALPQSVQGVLALKDKLDEMTAKAKELKISEDKLAAARQVLIDQQKQAILDPVKQYLRPEDGGTAGMSQWDTQQADINKKFDDARAANQKLIDETGQRAIAFWKLNQAQLDALKQLAEDAIASLGLPLEQTKSKVANLKSTLDFLKKSLDAGTLSQGRYNEVMKEVADQSNVEILGLMQQIFDAMGATGKSAEVQAQLAQANFLIQVAQVNILYNALSALGDAGVALQVKLKPFLDYINDPSNWPTFKPGDQTPVTTSTGTVGTSNDPFADAANLKATIIAQAREWAGSVVGDLTRSAQEMKDKLADLQAQALALWNYASGTLAGPLADLQAAYDQARQHFFDSVDASFVRVPEAVQQARDLKARIDDANQALATLGASAQQLAALATATAGAVNDFVGDSLQQYERLGHSEFAGERSDILSHFDELRTAFQTIGASADQMARLEQARVDALDDWWKRATAGIKSLVDDIRKQDPRVTSQQKFLDARQEFRDLLTRARAGDLDALSQLQDAAGAYRDQAQAFLGGGVGSDNVLDEIANSLQGLINVGPDGETGADPVASRLDDTNDILTQIRDGILGTTTPVAASTTGIPIVAITTIGGVMRRPKKGDEDDDVRDTAASGSTRGRRRVVRSDGGQGGETPPILYIPNDGGDDGDPSGPEMVSLLRKLATGEEKKAKASDDKDTRDRGRILADSQERAALAAALNNMAGQVAALVRAIEAKYPAGLT